MAGKQHVFIVGSKGIPASYGGFETFVEKLTQYKKSPRIQYHVAVLSDHTGEYMHNGARCFCVKVPDIGSAKAVYYDGAALDAGIRKICTIADGIPLHDAIEIRRAAMSCGAMVKSNPNIFPSPIAI